MSVIGNDYNVITGLALPLPVTSGGTGGADANTARASLGIESATTGTTKISSGNTAQRFNQVGIRYNTQTTSFEGYNGSVWSNLGGTGGTGDVVGPVSSSTDNLATYSDTTGKLIKDSGVAISSIALKNSANTFTATQTPDNGTATVSTTSTYTFDGTDQIRVITLTNAITVTFGAPTGITQHAAYKFILAAGDTNARTFAWNGAYKFPGASPQLTTGTTTNGAFDVITFIGGAANTLIYQGHVSDVR